MAYFFMIWKVALDLLVSIRGVIFCGTAESSTIGSYMFVIRRNNCLKDLLWLSDGSWSSPLSDSPYRGLNGPSGRFEFGFTIRQLAAALTRLGRLIIDLILGPSWFLTFCNCLDW